MSNVANVSFLSNFKTQIKYSEMYKQRSLIINRVNICCTKQRAVLEEVRSRSVTRCVPQTAAADLHALSPQLADVHQDNNLVSGNQQVLHAGSNHLMGEVNRTKCGQRTDLTAFPKVPHQGIFRTDSPHTVFLSFSVTTLLHISPLGGNW